jgi:hypothetical protein
MCIFQLFSLLFNKETSLVAGLARQQLAGTGILPDSGGILIKYRNSCPQEFLRKIPVKRKKTGIPVAPPKTHSCEKFLRKTQEKKKSSEILSGTVFWTQ